MAINISIFKPFFNHSKMSQVFEKPECKLDKSVQNTTKLEQIRMRNTAYSIYELERINSEISYAEFFKRYLFENRPCILSSSFTDSWKSRKEWVDGTGGPNLFFLAEKFGRAIVPVADCGKEEYSSHPKESMTLTSYIEYLRNNREKGQNNDKCLYLKDWHFTKLIHGFGIYLNSFKYILDYIFGVHQDIQDYWNSLETFYYFGLVIRTFRIIWNLTHKLAFPDYQAYDTPMYFRSDWMNEFWDSRNNIDDDYRFVYIGPKGSWTPLHADVFHSFSWSANICGRKKWIFFLPGEEAFLQDRFGQLAYDVTSSGLKDQSKFPDYYKLTRQIEVIQEQGEIIFVPSGWHHQVFNMEDTISINHNWLNGCNVDLCWEHVRQSLESVKKEIEDCREMEEWEERCQLILKANAGIDYTDFFKFMIHIAGNRFAMLERLSPVLKEESVENSKADIASQNITNCGTTGLSHVCSQCRRSTYNTSGSLYTADKRNVTVSLNQSEGDSELQHSKMDCVMDKSVSETKTGLLKDSKSNTKFQENTKHDHTEETITDSKNNVQSEHLESCNCSRTSDIHQQLIEKIDGGISAQIFSRCIVDEQNECLFNKEHLLFDLLKVKSILQDMKDNPDFQGIKVDDCSSSLDRLVSKIETYTCDYDEK